MWGKLPAWCSKPEETGLDVTTDNDLMLPDRIKRLESLAYNLWWSWNPEARYLFRRIDRFVWERVGENAVLFV